MSVTPAEIIVRRRSVLGLSQVQLAERIGRAASTIRRWERGDAVPPASILPTLATALQVAPRDLAVAFGLETPKADEPAVTSPKTDQPPVASPAEKAGVAPSATEPAAKTPAEPAAKPPDEPAVDSPKTDEPAVASPAEKPQEAAEMAPPVAAPSPVPAAPRPSITEEPTQAVAMPTAVAAPPQQRTPRRSPLRRAPALDPAEGLSYLEDNRQRIRYWLRGLLTVVVGIILLIILFWAFGELGQALGDVWDLFGDDAPPPTAPGTEF